MWIKVAQAPKTRVFYNNTTDKVALVIEELSPIYADNLVDVCCFISDPEIYNILVSEVTKWKSGYKIRSM